MNNSQDYCKQIDLSTQKSISSKKLKDIISSTIKWKIASMYETESEILKDMLHDHAFELLLFGKYQLGLYSDDEYTYIYDIITEATKKVHNND